jgi:hypothetical protein
MCAISVSNFYNSMDADTIFCILNHLELHDVITCCLINKQFNTTSKSELIWKNLSESIYPGILCNYRETYRKSHIVDKWFVKSNIGSSINAKGIVSWYVNSIPPEINVMTNLRRIDLPFNRIKSIPDEFFELTKLKGFSINTGSLKSISPRIGLLTNLRTLYLDGNEFSSIPKEIGLLTNLKELSISRNHIGLISFDIGRMTKLEKLFLYANPIKSITKHITSLTNLFQLHLDHDQKEMVPQELDNIIVLH